MNSISFSKIIFIPIILTLYTKDVLSFPEQSIWRTDVHKDTTLSMTKSMISKSEVHAKIHCDKPVDLNVKWLFLHTPCLDLLQDLNTTGWLTIPNKMNYTSARISAKMGSTQRECQPLKPLFLESVADSTPAIPPDLLTMVSTTGDHMLVLQITSDKFQQGSSVHLEVEMRNPDGTYLSAVEFPFLPFNGIMSLLYLLLTIIWLSLAIHYRKDLMRIQFCIGVVLLLGFWEHLTWFAIYQTLENTGQAAHGGAIFAELIACAKRTLARMLVLIACLGYGVTKPRLGAIWFRRCMAIGVLYFILVTVEGMTRVVLARFVITRFRLATLSPLLCVDVVIVWWIFIYLARTLRETRMRHNVIKHKLYRQFSYVLVALSAASVAFMVWSVYVFKSTPCIQTWRYLWIDDAFWQSLFVVILAVILILWRPSGANREYAYSPLLDFNPAADDYEDEEEEVLLDRLDQENSDVTHVRSRPTEEENGSKDVIPMAILHPVQKPIPASLVERIGIEAASGPNDPAPVWKVE